MTKPNWPEYMSTVLVNRPAKGQNWTLILSGLLWWLGFVALMVVFIVLAHG